jgi:hypothetical protein
MKVPELSAHITPLDYISIRLVEELSKQINSGGEIPSPSPSPDS